MSRPIRYSSRYTVTPERLYATLADREFLQARLDSIGGDNAVLLDLAADAEAAKYSLRQGVSRENLPSAVQKVLRGGLSIERTEAWHRAGPGRYDGTVSARVKDAPGTVGGRLTIGGVDETSEFRVEGEVKVDVPFVGGKIEEAIAAAVVRLMEREARFAQEWLSRS